MVASFFVEALEKLGAPQMLRTDCGTENNVCAAIQSTIHPTSNAHLYGSSVTNQRIEALWCKLKPAVAGWKQHFKQLHENHLYAPQDDNQLSAFRFSFMDLIQETLNGFMLYWNTHHVRQAVRMLAVCQICFSMLTNNIKQKCLLVNYRRWGPIVKAQQLLGLQILTSCLYFLWLVLVPPLSAYIYRT